MVYMLPRWRCKRNNAHRLRHPDLDLGQCGPCPPTDTCLQILIVDRRPLNFGAGSSLGLGDVLLIDGSGFLEMMDLPTIVHVHGFQGDLLALLC